MKVRIRRSDLRAKGKYDFRRLEEKNHLFLPCRIEEEKETVCMNFDLRGMQIFEELKKEERLTPGGGARRTIPEIRVFTGAWQPIL